jgi:hypothetical protein
MLSFSLSAFSASFSALFVFPASALATFSVSLVAFALSFSTWVQAGSRLAG